MGSKECKTRLRQPIVSVLGHVDHGKTTFLDFIRGTNVVAKEAGKITQHIGATEVPLDAIKDLCGHLMADKEFLIPGLLFIDTPGHKAFTSLRKRGSALAELAVLMIDINEGLKPQGEESIEILRMTHTPFIIFANKIDKINGWEIDDRLCGEPFILNVKRQSEGVIEALDNRLYDLMGKLYNKYKISAERYDRITDFTKTVAIIPGSALYGIGVADCLLVLTGLAQRYLETKIRTEITEDYGRGTILEVKEEKGLGKTMDVIVYDGVIKQGYHLIIASMDGEIKRTKIRALLKPKPLDEIRDPRDKFDYVACVEAAAGIKISTQEVEGVMAGMPIVAVSKEELIDKFIDDLKREVEINIPLESDGIYIKADTVGALEALGNELQGLNIKIRNFGIGDISKRDVVDVATIEDPLKRVILGFNVKVLGDAHDLAIQNDVNIIVDDVIYRLIESYEEWLETKMREREESLRKEVVHPGMIKILADYIFRIKDPAIVGVRVLGGRIRPGQTLINENGRIVGRIRSIQKEKEAVKEARLGEEVAISISSAVVGRTIHRDEILYVDMPESHARRLFTELKATLTPDELDTLEKIAKIKRRITPFWGM